MKKDTSEVVDLVKSVRKHKKFKQLASYSVQCLQKVRLLIHAHALHPSTHSAPCHRCSHPPMLDGRRTWRLHSKLVHLMQWLRC